MTEPRMQTKEERKIVSNSLHKNCLLRISSVETRNNIYICFNHIAREMFATSHILQLNIAPRASGDRYVNSVRLYSM